MSNRHFVPDDFQLSLLSEAYQQHHYAMKYCNTHELDQRTSFWVVRRNAWMELLRSEDFLTSVDFNPQHRKELMGLPVRLTIEDESDVPIIQLVMEPLLRKGV